MTETELHECIRSTRSGNKDAFHKIYAHSKDYVYGTVSLLVNNKQDAADVVSEVYVEVFKSLYRYDFDKPFRSWITGVVIRQVRNWNRKLWRKFRLYERGKLMELPEPSPDSESLFLRHKNCK